MEEIIRAHIRPFYPLEEDLSTLNATWGSLIASCLSDDLIARLLVPGQVVGVTASEYKVDARYGDFKKMKDLVWKSEHMEDLWTIGRDCGATESMMGMFRWTWNCQLNGKGQRKCFLVVFQGVMDKSDHRNMMNHSSHLTSIIIADL